MDCVQRFEKAIQAACELTAANAHGQPHVQTTWPLTQVHGSGDEAIALICETFTTPDLRLCAQAELLQHTRLFSGKPTRAAQRVLDTLDDLSRDQLIHLLSAARRRDIDRRVALATSEHAWIANDPRAMDEMVTRAISKARAAGMVTIAPTRPALDDLDQLAPAATVHQADSHHR